MSRAQVDALRAMLAGRPAGLSLDERRAGFERQAAMVPLPDDFAEEVVEVGGVPARWVWVDGCDVGKALVWLHGGAFTLGSSASYRAFGARLARVSGARVLIPDYRLVPEHPFPAALHDCVAVLGALDCQVAVGGDSCGGNLALAAVQARIAAGHALPAALWLVSPYLDLTHAGASIGARAARDPFIDTAYMPATAAAYHGAADPADPRVSPLFGRMADLPPLLVQVGSDEVLYDDARRLADAVPGAVFQEWIGMIHVWPYFAHLVDEGGWAIAQGGDFVRQMLQA